MKLTKEQIQILKHTINNGRYCGDSESMDDLCDKDLMKCIGRLSFCPDKYYQITRKGKEFVNDNC